MKKTSKKTKSPAPAPKRKVAVKDLKAKDAGSVRGGVAYIKLGDVRGESRDDKHKDEITF